MKKPWKKDIAKITGSIYNYNSRVIASASNVNADVLKECCNRIENLEKEIEKLKSKIAENKNEIKELKSKIEENKNEI